MFYGITVSIFCLIIVYGCLQIKVLLSVCGNLRTENNVYSQKELLTMELFNKALELEGQSINDISIQYNGDLFSQKLSELVQSKSIIVLIILNRTCSPCVESVMTIINEEFPESRSDSLLIFSDFSLRNRINFMGKELVKMNSDLISKTVDIDAPFMFILDSNMIVKCIHIFNRANPSATKKYLEVMKKRFFFITIGIYKFETVCR